MAQHTSTPGCDHIVAVAGAKQIRQSELQQEALAFFSKIADFNIRGGFQEIPHPGFFQECKFCPECGEKIAVAIDKDDTFFQAVQSYDCKGSVKLEAQKQKELETITKSKG